MNFKVYQIAATRTMDPDKSLKDAVYESVLGVVGEGAELGNKLKKVLYHGHDLDLDEVAVGM